jgi:O-antigen ligase
MSRPVFACPIAPEYTAGPCRIGPLAPCRYQGKPGSVTLQHLRFFLCGLFIVHALDNPAAHGRFLRLCAWLLLFWVLDGVVQTVFGHDVFGFTPYGGRTTALFGDRGLEYVLLLTAFCPLLWEYARTAWPRWALVVTVAATVLVILTAGTRSSWINIAVILLAYAALLWWKRGRFPVRAVAVAVIAVILGTAVLLFASERFRDRVDQTVAAVGGEPSPRGESIGHRFWIWKGATNMIRAHPVNGVGVRGFRYAYSEYADPDDPFMKGDEPVIPTHSHQLLLEVLSETGLFGALGLLLLLGLLTVAAFRAHPATQRLLLPYGLCILVAYFPVNTHMAISSAFWAQTVWWLIALFCAAYGAGWRLQQEGLSSPR